MTCPHCKKPISQKKIVSEAARINQARRKERGRPTTIYRPCKWEARGCTEVLGTQKMREHEPQCPYKIDRRANGLGNAVREVISSIGRPFTILDVVDELKRNGFQFTAAIPRLAVHAPLTMEIKIGTVRIIEHGIGKVPNVYEFVG